ncbi:hypothetical protein KC327_g17706, partial [Hortaea werneckii]
AEQRAKEERRDRQQMMGEREKNRMRKLRAQEGREWDSEKQGGDFGKGGRFDKRGGFAGDQKDYTDGREYLYREPRGGREGGGRGGRGGRDGRPAQQQPSAPPKQEDFPALPGRTRLVKRGQQWRGRRLVWLVGVGRIRLNPLHERSSSTAVELCFAHALGEGAARRPRIERASTLLA